MRGSPGHAVSRYMVASVLFLAAGSASAEAATSVAFLPHQAIYDLSLRKTRGNASLNGAQGRILYNFSGSSCEGYTTDFRQVSQLDGGESKSTVSDLRSTSWEDAEGKNYRFKIETRMNDLAPSAVDGTATRTAEGVVVKLKQPVTKTFTLDPNTIFPTEQVRRIIEAAREGKSVLELVVYDGSDDGEKVYNTLAVIGQPIPPERAPGDAAGASNDLKSQKRWPVTVSYYDSKAKVGEGEQTPVYAMSFELYEDGVSRALVLDYNDFVLAGAMTKMESKGGGKPCK